MPQQPDLVTGKPKPPQYARCGWARMPYNPDRCGPDGQHWEPIQPPGFV